MKTSRRGFLSTLLGVAAVPFLPKPRPTTGTLFDPHTNIHKQWIESRFDVERNQFISRSHLYFDRIGPYLQKIIDEQSSDLAFYSGEKWDIESPDGIVTIRRPEFNVWTNVPSRPHAVSA